MTDRARVALLPDETPVENIGLRLQTGIALRRNGTTTLGELRELPDRELLRLRYRSPPSHARPARSPDRPATARRATQGQAGSQR